VASMPCSVPMIFVFPLFIVPSQEEALCPPSVSFLSPPAYDSLEFPPTNYGFSSPPPPTHTWVFSHDPAHAFITSLNPCFQGHDRRFLNYPPYEWEFFRSPCFPVPLPRITCEAVKPIRGLSLKSLGPLSVFHTAPPERSPLSLLIDS